MLRGEAYKLKLIDLGKKGIIDKIYDDFEEALKEEEFKLQLALAQLSAYGKRTCENCKHMSLIEQTYSYSSMKCSYGIGDINEFGSIFVTPKFGCVKWEGKDVK